MKQLTICPIAVLLALLFAANTTLAQFNVKITVNSGTATTTCTDPIGAPDPTWSVNIANQGWVNYPFNGLCYTNPPNLQFDQTYQCLNQVPPTIQVCFRAFENDASILNPCTPVTSCLAEMCMDVPVPPQGSQSFTIQLPAGLPSGGSANLTIATSGIPGGINDAICDALDIGVLLPGTTVGDADTSVFNNYCASNTGDPDPGGFGNFWVNNQGVWFKFTTSANPGALITITAKSDPSNFGDAINLQVGVFTSSDNSCTGTFSFITQNHNPNDWDEYVNIDCPLPNTTYFILVDGVSDTPVQVDGWFGIEITETGIPAAAELRCEAENFGQVPLGGSVGTNGLVTNRCTNNSNAAPATAFGVQKSVWFAFTPPPTGHVLVTCISDTVIDPIGIQLAAYRSSNGACDGIFTEITSKYTAADLDETIELHCLDPNQTYFIMVDGAVGNLNVGNFSVTVTDAGDETPVTNQSPVLCSGESLTVGANVYSQTGIYHDTLALPGGCDSIVNTNLTILAPVQVNLQIVNQGIGLGNTNGQAQAFPTGGAGNFTFSWSDGQTAALGNNLVGGDNYCVEVTDQNGCVADTCFEMPYFIHFVPFAVSDTLNCFGDMDGVIRLTANGGIPPYQFTWQNAANTLNGAGAVTSDGQIVSINDLPAGQYSFQMVDAIFDTTFTVTVVQPEQLKIASVSVDNASCYNTCDGGIMLSMTGGTGTLQYLWSGGEVNPMITGVCAGGYQVTVTDANGCTAKFDFSVTQPAEFIATASQVQEVSCFQGADGQATVTTNGSPQSYLWSNGEPTKNIANLAGGNYTVTVTNLDGCTATSSVAVATPGAPVSAAISTENAIRCKGDENGSLRATPAGPGNSFSFKWSNGATGPVAQNLGAGDYAVTVTNEKGCEATATFSLGEPTEIMVETSTNALTCFDAPNAGVITVEQISGGVEPYQFSSNGLAFSPEKIISGYTAGQQVFYVKDAGGCVREFTATIEGPKEILVELDDDMVVDLGETINLDAFVSQPDLTFEWSPADWLSCSDCPNPGVTPLRGQLYTLVVTDDFGCTAAADIYIEVIKKRKVYVPNAFSPNGDGFNDEFMPFGGNDVSVIRDFKVFDRQGNLVYSASNFQPSDAAMGWTGAFKGKMMQPGVFVWFAQVEFIDGDVEVFKGDVTLMR
jgi:gliding motility-associated-like protein